MSLWRCDSCGRHVKVGAAACPFCAAPIRHVAVAALLSAMAACNPMTSEVYGGPPPRPPADAAVAVPSPVYGGPPPEIDAAAPVPSPTPTPTPSGHAQKGPPPPPAPVYGAPPPRNRQ